MVEYRHEHSDAADEPAGRRPLGRSGHGQADAGGDRGRASSSSRRPSHARTSPQAYALVTEQIRQGQSLKSWNTGNIAVIPYPVDAIKYAPMKIDFSYPNEAQIQVALLPKAGAKVRSQLFLMDLVKRNGKWLVNSWVPRSTPPVPNGSANNGAGG